MQRLTAVDASFLAQEGQSSHMHVGGVTIFEGPPPSIEAFREHLRSRLDLIPRYRQKLAFPPLQTGRPMWVDDPNFNLDYHVRNTALPSPGSDAQLLQLAARISSQRLDRSKPLWELWLVQGLEGNRFAMIGKTHHAVIDGISGVDIAQVILDISPAPTPPGVDLDEWQPHPEPTSAQLIASGVRGIASAGEELVSGVFKAINRPASAIDKLKEAAEGVGEIVWAGLNPAPTTPLNVKIGPHRRFAVIDNQLEDYKLVKNAFGTTVNDVVLAVVSGALRTFLRSRGVRTDGLELRALVPVSVRAEDEHNQLGNRLAAMRGPLPVYIEDPVQRLQFIKQEMDGIKESKQALGAEVIAGAQNFAPPTLLAQASRLNFSTRLFNLIVTNVPGPQFPLYLMGREMLEIYPVAFLPENHALAIAIMSYNGEVNFGLLADYDAVPDVEFIGEALQESLAQLVRAAKKKQKPTKSIKASGKSKTRAKAEAKRAPKAEAKASVKSKTKHVAATNGKPKKITAASKNGKPRITSG